VPPVISEDAYRRAHEALALVDRSDRGWIVLAGNDRRSYLQGLFTNDIDALTTGSGCYTAYLTPQGRMIADLWVYELGDVLLLSLDRTVKDTVLAKLDQFIFTEDVQLGDVSGTYRAIAVIGPEAVAALATILGMAESVLEALPDGGNIRGVFEGEPAIVLRTSDLGVSGFDVLVAAASGDALRQRLLDAGAATLDEPAARSLRVEAGIPKFHEDMDETTIPLEAGSEPRAISMTKGCYVGQEVIIRVLHRGRGRVAKKLVGLVLPESAAAERGDAVTADDKTVGALTSVAWSPRLGRPVALGYVQRDFVAPGTTVIVNGQSARVAALPFAAEAVSR
jgi:folate-binding protein YgfZ